MMHDHLDHQHEHDHDHEYEHSHEGEHHHDEGHGHSHGLVDESILRSKEGVRAVSLSLVVLLIAALLQAFVFSITNSVALLADLIHNFGDALTAIPLGAAFLLRSRRAERYAGFFVVATIFVSACVVAVQAAVRFMHPEPVGQLAVLVLGGLLGFAGNEIAALIRLRAGKHLNSPALIADGQHARIDGLVSLSVVLTAVLVWLRFQIADPVIAAVITVVILRITWQSFVTIRNHA